ncbi:MAG: hypothetical protein KGN84_17740 [Acidobacteriota bacterium]|nr:hypothetical protein [Acidobacteriota bacterium]
MPDTARILINLFDGTRNPAPNDLEWIANVSDGRPLSVRQTLRTIVRGPHVLVEVPVFNNLFDDYTVAAAGMNSFEQSGWSPVPVHPSHPAILDLMLFPKSGQPHFAEATWVHLSDSRRGVADIIQRECDPDTAADAYGAVLESRPKALACFLNIVTALAQIQLPSGKCPLDYYWNISWPKGNIGSMDWLNRLDSVFKQDRFFCYVDSNIIPDVQDAARQGSFAAEQNPGIFHSDATESYKQTQFDVSNVQLTFHGHDTASFTGPDGKPVSCVKIEPDMDYYKDLGSHGLLEVIPNMITHGLTEPAIAYMLRWMAGRRIGKSFNPLYTVERPEGA